VAINEALELAKRFGARQSPQFVNGILDRFLQKPREVAAATTSEYAVLAAAAETDADTAKLPENGRRVPASEDYCRALLAISETPERKFPAYFRTLLKTHCEAGPQTPAQPKPWAGKPHSTWWHDTTTWASGWEKSCTSTRPSTTPWGARFGFRCSLK
jgi:hypothetical protein